MSGSDLDPLLTIDGGGGEIKGEIVIPIAHITTVSLEGEKAVRVEVLGGNSVTISNAQPSAAACRDIIAARLRQWWLAQLPVRCQAGEYA